jgi:hypothetical protein
MLYTGIVDMEVSYDSRAVDDLSNDISAYLVKEIGRQKFADNLQIDIDLYEDADGRLDAKIVVSQWDGEVVQHKDF